jgi:type I restriction enzyme S subunit
MPRRSIALGDWESDRKVESNKFHFQKDDILFGKLRPYFHKVGIAPVDGICSTDILVITPKTGDWFGFALGHFSSDEVVKHADASSTGTKMPRTNWEDLARFRVALPEPVVARHFNIMIRPMVSRLQAGIHESRTLASLIDGLLPQLISGELRIPDAERIVERTV